MSYFVTSYRLVRDTTAPSPVRLNAGDGDLLVQYMRGLVELEDTETAWVLPLDRQLRLLSPGPITIARGVRDSVLIDAVKIVQAVAFFAAYGAVLVHGHPGGTAEPSPADNKLTVHLRNVLPLAGIELCDHLIIAPDAHYSYKQAGRL